VRAQLLHLSGPLRGRTDTYPGERVLLGTDPHSDLRYPAGTPGVATRHAEIAFAPDRCCYHLRRIDGRIFVNQREVEEVILEPNDLLELGVEGPKARFRVWLEPGACCKPVRTMLEDAQLVMTQSGARGFVTSLVRDLLTHATKTLKVGVPLAVVAVLGLTFWAGKVFGSRRPPAELADVVRRYEKDLQLFRTNTQKMLDGHERLRKEFEARALVVDKLMQQDRALHRVLIEYSIGVCLLAGEFGFEHDVSGTLVPALDSSGDPIVGQYTGSGFLADERGYVITNRHVVEPWFNNREIAPLLRLGLVPRLRFLRAFFPGKDPLDIDLKTIRTRQDDIDVATFKIDPAGLPVLPLSKDNPETMRGAHVLVLGYPAGVDGLLAKTDNQAATEITSKAKTMDDLVVELSKRKAIKPLPTQGNLNEVLEKQLVYDAQTTHGGSGGPVFGPDGTVIGVNFAILASFGGSNFGVPIRYAIELLPP
jgi:S1-C subfamily serine protease